MGTGGEPRLGNGVAGGLENYIAASPCRMRRGRTWRGSISPMVPQSRHRPLCCSKSKPGGGPQTSPVRCSTRSISYGASSTILNRRQQSHQRRERISHEAINTPMARPRSNDLIEPMDLANMRLNGVRSLAVQYHQCRHEVVVNVDHLSDSGPAWCAPNAGPSAPMSGRIGGNLARDADEGAGPIARPFFVSTCRFFGLRTARSICHNSIGLRHAFSTQGPDRLTDWDPSRPSGVRLGFPLLH
jgi:hypothetical protein